MQHRVDDDLSGQRAVLHRGDAVGGPRHAADRVHGGIGVELIALDLPQHDPHVLDGRTAGAEHEAALGDVRIEVQIVFRRRRDAGEDVDDRALVGLLDRVGDERPDRGHQRKVGERSVELLALWIDQPQGHAVGLRHRLGLAPQAPRSADRRDPYRRYSGPRGRCKCCESRASGPSARRPRRRGFGRFRESRRWRGCVGTTRPHGSPWYRPSVSCRSAGVRRRPTPAGRFSGRPARC